MDVEQIKTMDKTEAKKLYYAINEAFGFNKKNNAVSFDIIALLNYVNDKLGFDIRAKNRKRLLVDVRSCFIYYLHKEIQIDTNGFNGWLVIGRLMDNDHSTIIHAQRRHRDTISLRVKDEKYEAINEKMKQLFEDYFATI